MHQQFIIPTTSILNRKKRINYQDCVSIKIHSTIEITVNDAARAFFLCAPIWVEKLMELRNRIVGLLGFKTGQEEQRDMQKLLNSNFEVEEKFGLFEITDRNQDEIIMGADDKHLNFRVSLLLEKQNPNTYILYLSTTVQINNRLGKFYFFVVKPFHKIIIRVFIKRIKEQLTSQDAAIKK